MGLEPRAMLDDQILAGQLHHASLHEYPEPVSRWAFGPIGETLSRPGPLQLLPSSIGLRRATVLLRQHLLAGIERGEEVALQGVIAG